MPIYQYRCNKCQENFEVEQRMTDDALTVHDICGGNLSKVFSSVGIVWKGQGFYKTDNTKRSSSGTSDKPSGKESTSTKETAKPKKTEPTG